MTIRLIAIDIDGTLMPSSGTQISRRNREALLAAQKAGIEIVIATGRREAYAMPLISSIGLSSSSVMISSNGAVVRGFDGSLIDRRYLPAEIARGLCHELRGHGTLVFTFDREGNGALVIEDIARLRGRIERWVEANRPYLKEIHPIESAFDDAELPIQGMVSGTVEGMRQAEIALRSWPLANQVSMHRTEYASRDLGILDLLPAGCSKGSAIKQVARIRNLERQEIMGIGDNLNDLEMLEWVGHGVLMANASEEMLDIAGQRGWRITDTNDDDGVAQVIESLLNQGDTIRPATPNWPVSVPDGNSIPSGSKAQPKDTIAGWPQ